MRIGMSREARGVSKTFPIFGFLLGVFSVGFYAPAQAPQGKIARVGYLSTSSASEAATRTEAFRRGLNELGYIEGKHVRVEFRYGEGDFARLPGLAAELVQSKVDVIFTAGPSVTRPVKEATSIRAPFFRRLQHFSDSRFAPCSLRFAIPLRRKSRQELRE
jgi:hypothetical protein